MQITCLHTMDIHIPTFKALFDELSPDAKITHVVRNDLLMRAQTEGVAGIRADTLAVLQELGDADAVLCTCSTLGMMVDELNDPRYLRIDRPMMEQACKIGPNVLMAICLESTRDASLGLLKETAKDMGLPLQPTVHLCDGAWPYFTSGDTAGFANAVARSVHDAVDGHDCVILAQASMQVAAPLLADLGIPVLTSPAMAAQAAVARALG